MGNCLKVLIKHKHGEKTVLILNMEIDFKSSYFISGKKPSKIQRNKYYFVSLMVSSFNNND